MYYCLWRDYTRSKRNQEWLLTAQNTAINKNPFESTKFILAGYRIYFDFQFHNNWEKYAFLSFILKVRTQNLQIFFLIS